MCQPDGNSTSGSAAEATKAGPSPLLGAKLRQRVPSVAHPSTHLVVDFDAPPGSHVLNISLAHDVAPGEQPHRSTGQSGGTIVQVFLSPPETANSPSTSQNG